VNRRAILSGIIGVVIITLAAAGLAQEPPRFADRDRLLQAMDNDPERVLAALETVLTQPQIRHIEATLFPVAQPDEQLRTLRAVRLQLSRLGLEAADPLVTAVAERVAALEDAVRTEPTPVPIEE
jgi:hypothetical protein